MLRPERMSKVSLAGSKSIMEPVIENLHDLRLVHLERYDNSWTAFEPGTPLEGSEQISEQLVTVRSIESILDIDEEDAGPRHSIADDDVADEIESIRGRVNELDDRRTDLGNEIRVIDEKLTRLRPFATLGIDLDLLWGYQSIESAVVIGREDAVREAVETSDAISGYELYSEDNVVAIFVRSRADESVLDDVLVGIDVQALDVPEESGSPQEYVRELEHRKQQLQTKIRRLESELEDVKLEVAGFMLAIEEELSIEAQKTEVPIRFATTEHSFIAEGWVPTQAYDDFEATLRAEFGDRIEIDELEQVDFDTVAPGHGHGNHEAETATDGGQVVSMHKREPPVVQDNPETMRPFQLLVEAINRPRYYEIDPTVILFLTFPTMFGLMIGDVGYGILYMAIGYLLYRNFESPGIRSLGGVAIWCGIFTTFFGFFYGELFGFHTFDYHFWQPVVGLEGAPIEKGLDSAFALFWLIIALLIGLVHLTIGYVFGFINELEGHDFVTAAAGNLSWVLLMNGVWVWIFSVHASHLKPAFLYTVFDGQPMAIGFAGFSAEVGLLGLAIAAIGFIGMIYGEYLHEGGIGIAIGLLESLSGALVNVISYARVTAVLLAKAGMAFVVNLLTVGAYRGADGRFHFLDPATSTAPADGELMFGGIMATDAGIAVAIITVLVGVVIFIIGHLIVLGLGITSAGLQGIRLEYVEFFGKFYDGGGDKYEPFGYDRSYTSK